MEGELEEYLTRELTRTGYPLEIEVSSMLEDMYIVYNNEYFFDSDENKAREIDVSAYPLEGTLRDREAIAPFEIVHLLALECKRSDTHAWVFLTRPEGAFRFQGQLFDFLSCAAKDALKLFLDDILSKYNAHLHYDSFKRVARSYAEIKYQGKQSKKNGKNEIFEAKNQLVKFTAFSANHLVNLLKGGEFDPMTYSPVWFCHPTVVFDGKLYEAIIESGSPRLYERKHLLLATSYSPPYISEFPETVMPYLPYLIDVVRKDYFADFLKILKTDYATIRNCISDNIQELIEMLKKGVIKYSK